MRWQGHSRPQVYLYRCRQRTATDVSCQLIDSGCTAMLVRRLSRHPHERASFALLVTADGCSAGPCTVRLSGQTSCHHIEFCIGAHLQQRSPGKAHRGALRPQPGEMRHQGFMVPQLQLLRHGRPRCDLTVPQTLSSTLHEEQQADTANLGIICALKYDCDHTHDMPDVSQHVNGFHGANQRPHLSAQVACGAV